MPPSTPRSLFRAIPNPRPLRALQALPQRHQRPSSSSTTPPSPSNPSAPSSPSAILSTPTWSIQSLLPPEPSSTTPVQEDPVASEITPTQLDHLLRLSALPPPASAAASARMLATLRSQLHFVRAIQQVDTTGVAPLYAIRDETRAGRDEATIGLDTPAIQAALAGEEAVGRCRRPRRKRGLPPSAESVAAESWDVLGQASERAGGYFVVKGTKPGEEGA